MSFFVEVSSTALIKHGETLCGDNVAIRRTPDSFIAVLSDGLGSGVKANILATLTAKIASTMLENGSPIEEVVHTLVQTLPKCKVRGIAYATFTVVQVFKDGRLYVAESDNPELLFFRNDELFPLPKKKTVIENKTICESTFNLQEEDTLVIVSDGIVNAGIGGVRPLGWPLKEIATECQYIFEQRKAKFRSKDIAEHLKDRCGEFYRNHIGDDATTVCLRVRKPRDLVVAVGPPQDKAKDTEFVRNFSSRPGKKVVCGGTTSTLVARELGLELKVNIDDITAEPPTGEIVGIDLVTEGIVTLCRALDLIREVEGKPVLIRDNDGAGKLARILLQADRVCFLVGQAINPAHQNPNLPHHLALKNQVVREVSEILQGLGKEITISYY